MHIYTPKGWQHAIPSLQTHIKVTYVKDHAVVL